MQNDVVQKAIVGQDTVENVRVSTRFSIMPENRNYKPFGTSAFDMTSLDPLIGYTRYTRRYDTWNEAERGHRETLERIRHEYARSRAAEQRAEALAGTAGEVRLAISANLPALFQVAEQSVDEVIVSTPLLRADSSSIEVSVSDDGHGFSLSAPVGASPVESIASLGKLNAAQVDRISSALGVSVESGALACRADDPSQIGHAIVRLGQAVACLSFSATEES